MPFNATAAPFPWAMETDAIFQESMSIAHAIEEQTASTILIDRFRALLAELLTQRTVKNLRGQEMSDDQKRQVGQWYAMLINAGNAKT